MRQTVTAPTSCIHPATQRTWNLNSPAPSEPSSPNPLSDADKARPDIGTIKTDGRFAFFVGNDQRRPIQRIAHVRNTLVFLLVIGRNIGTGLIKALVMIILNFLSRSSSV